MTKNQVENLTKTCLLQRKVVKKCIIWWPWKTFVYFLSFKKITIRNIANLNCLILYWIIAGNLPLCEIIWIIFSFLLISMTLSCLFWIMWCLLNWKKLESIFERLEIILFFFTYLHKVKIISYIVWYFLVISF